MNGVICIVVNGKEEKNTVTDIPLLEKLGCIVLCAFAAGGKYGTNGDARVL